MMFFKATYDEINFFSRPAWNLRALNWLNACFFQIYEKTRQRCCQIFGEEHHMMCTLCFNTGIVYEDAKDTANAYKYFRMALGIGSKVFGPKHRMTQVYRDTLKEKKYVALAKKHGDTMDWLRLGNSASVVSRVLCVLVVVDFSHAFICLKMSFLCVNFSITSVIILA